MIFVADDDEDVLLSYRALLHSAGLDCETFSDGGALLRAAEGKTPELSLLDLRMPPPDGLEVLKQLRARDPDSKVIVITGEGDVPSAVEAMKRGALDFLQKPVDGDLLISIVEDVLAGPDKPAPTETGVFDALTPREREVTEFLVKGFSNKEAALQLGISYRTVEVHRARIMEKTNAASFSELIRMAISGGVI